MKKPALIALVFACLGTAPVLAAETEATPPAATQAPANPAKPTFTANPDQEIARLIKHKGDVEKGKEAYKVCRGCHKADASGKPEAGYPQLAGQHVSVLIKQMVDVRAGRRSSPKMHPFIEGDVVATEEVADIAVYLNSLPIPENAKGEGTMLEHGEKLYTRQCATCHGKGGEGNAAKFIPRVAGQHYLYLYKQTLESRDHGRNNSNPKMVKLLQPYSEADIAAVSDYMARLPVKR